MTDLLFIYGTLLQPGNPFADYLRRNCTVIASGKVKGILYDIGEYPGIILSSNAVTNIKGTVVKLHRPQENLKIIDDYEGVGADQEQPNLYTREMVSVETANGAINAWVYVYNLSVDGVQVITSGDYTEYIRQKKSPGN